MLEGRLVTSGADQLQRRALARLGILGRDLRPEPRRGQRLLGAADIARQTRRAGRHRRIAGPTTRLLEIAVEGARVVSAAERQLTDEEVVEGIPRKRARRRRRSGRRLGRGLRRLPGRLARVLVAARVGLRGRLLGRRGRGGFRGVRAVALGFGRVRRRRRLTRRRPFAVLRRRDGGAAGEGEQRGEQPRGGRARQTGDPGGRRAHAGIMAHSRTMAPERAGRAARGLV